MLSHALGGSKDCTALRYGGCQNEGLDDRVHRDIGENERMDKKHTSMPTPKTDLSETLHAHDALFFLHLSHAADGWSLTILTARIIL